jgi:hypothetical protein
MEQKNIIDGYPLTKEHFQTIQDETNKLIQSIVVNCSVYGIYAGCEVSITDDGISIGAGKFYFKNGTHAKSLVQAVPVNTILRPDSGKESVVTCILRHTEIIVTNNKAHIEQSLGSIELLYGTTENKPTAGDDCLILFDLTIDHDSPLSTFTPDTSRRDNSKILGSYISSVADGISTSTVALRENTLPRFEGYNNELKKFTGNIDALDKSSIYHIEMNKFITNASFATSEGDSFILETLKFEGGLIQYVYTQKASDNEMYVRMNNGSWSTWSSLKIPCVESLDDASSSTTVKASTMSPFHTLLTTLGEPIANATTDLNESSAAHKESTENIDTITKNGTCVVTMRSGGGAHPPVSPGTKYVLETVVYSGGSHILQIATPQAGGGVYIRRKQGASAYSAWETLTVGSLSVSKEAFGMGAIPGNTTDNPRLNSAEHVAVNDALVPLITDMRGFHANTKPGDFAGLPDMNVDDNLYRNLYHVTHKDNQYEENMLYPDNTPLLYKYAQYTSPYGLSMEAGIINVISSYEGKHNVVMMERLHKTPDGVSHLVKDGIAVWLDRDNGKLEVLDEKGFAIEKSTTATADLNGTASGVIRSHKCKMLYNPEQNTILINDMAYLKYSPDDNRMIAVTTPVGAGNGKFERRHIWPYGDNTHCVFYSKVLDTYVCGARVFCSTSNKHLGGVGIMTNKETHEWTYYGYTDSADVEDLDFNFVHDDVNNNVIVAVCDGGNYYTSPDGITWTKKGALPFTMDPNKFDGSFSIRGAQNGAGTGAYIVVPHAAPDQYGTVDSLYKYNPNTMTYNKTYNRLTSPKYNGAYTDILWDPIHNMYICIGFVVPKVFNPMYKESGTDRYTFYRGSSSVILIMDENGSVFLNSNVGYAYHTGANATECSAFGTTKVSVPMVINMNYDGELFFSTLSF